MDEDKFYTRPPGTPPQISAGGVVARMGDGQVEIALSFEKKHGAYVLPKGHVDPYESFEGAAVREVAEELGFTKVVLLGELGFGERLQATKDNPKWKITRFYLFLTRQEKAVPQDPKHGEPRWFSIEEAVGQIKWREQRDLVERNRDRIRELIRIHWV